jgi:hypothetical protein
MVHVAFWILFGFSIIFFGMGLILLTQTLLDNKTESIASGRTNDVVLDYIFDSSVQQSTLILFDNYYKENILEGTITDIKGLDIPISLLPSQILDPTNQNYQLAGIYDNSLAIIFASQRGDGNICTKLCNSMLGIMCIEGYYPNETTTSERILNYNGLYRRYNTVTGRHSTLSQNTDVIIDPMVFTDNSFCSTLGNSNESFYHSGDNAWVGIAFCKTVLKFGPTMSTRLRNRYINAAYDQCIQITQNHFCDVGGFSGYWSEDQTKEIITTEQSTISALASLLIQIEKNYQVDYNTIQLNQVRSICQTYITSIFHNQSIADECFRANTSADTNVGYYYIGTGPCRNASVPLCTSAILCNTQSWLYLSQTDRNQNNKSLSMDFIQNICTIVDTDADPRGCGNLSRNPCTVDFFSEEQIYYGFAYSDIADGIQWTTSASALMSLYSFYLQDAQEKDKENIKGILNVRFNSMNRMAIKYAGQGVPSSFRSEVAYAGNQDPQNSGLGFSFWNYPDTAATMWTGLTLHFMNEMANAAYIPFNSLSTDTIDNMDYNYPNWIDEYNSNRLTCLLFDTEYPDLKNCGVCECGLASDPIPDIPKTISVYCDLFENTPASRFKNPDGQLDQFNVQNVSQFPTLCSSPYIRVCSPEKQAKGIQNLYTQWAIPQINPDTDQEIPLCVKCSPT